MTAPRAPDDSSPPSLLRPRRHVGRSSKHPFFDEGPDRGTLLHSGLPRLMDERSDPNFRAIYGLLARRSGALDAAVSRIRLSGMDLRPEELRRLGRIRVLLTEVNALTLRSEAEASLADREKAGNLTNLLEMMESGVIEVRSAPLGGWAPDFSVFRRNGHPWMVLVGLHWFARPYPHGGPALASLHGPEAAARTGRRFEGLWRAAHDIGPAILHILHEAQARSGNRQREGSTSGSRNPGSGDPDCSSLDRTSSTHRPASQRFESS